jgi:hypothetical protein
MKKLILLALFSLLIIPSLASAEITCTASSYPFRYCRVIQNFTDVIAGEESCAIVSFKYIGDTYAPIVARINVSAENYEFWKEDFTGYGILNSSLIYGTEKWGYELVCKNPETIIFNQTGDTFTVPNYTYYCYHEPTLFILPPATQNQLKVCMKPNVAIKPATFTFNFELMSEVGVLWIEPEFNISVNGSYSIPDANLEFFNYGNENATLKASIYSTIFITQIPKERPVPLFYVDLKNETPITKIGVRYYYDENRLLMYDWNESNIRFYKFNGAAWSEIPSTINTSENYVETNLTSFSLYGIFTSHNYFQGPQGPAGPMGATGPAGPAGSQGPAGEVRNITTIKEIPAKAVCGNNICEVGESCSICPSDCKCANGYECIEGICLPKAVCGNGVCERGENNANCPEDCPAAPTGLGAITGAIAATVTNPLYAGIITLIIIAVVLTILRFKFIKRK